MASPHAPFILLKYSRLCLPSGRISLSAVEMRDRKEILCDGDFPKVYENILKRYKEIIADLSSVLHFKR